MVMLRPSCLLFGIIMMLGGVHLNAAAGPTDKGLGLGSALARLPAGVKPPDRWAVLIGSSDYRDDRIPDLPACANDIAGLGKVLTDPAVGLFPPDHVTTIGGDQVTARNVIEALDQVAMKAGPDDLVVIFYSGHGTIDPRGRAYWVMHDTNPDRLRSTALPENDVTELLGEIRTSRLVTLIDACYSAATVDVGKTKDLVNLAKIYPKFEGKGRLAMTASSGEQLSVVISDTNHPGHGYSAFAWHLIEAMRGACDEDQDGVVTVDEVWGYVKDRTERTSRAEGGEQQPQLKGQLGSRFLLTVVSDRFVTVQAERAKRQAQVEHQIDVLKQHALAKRISAEQYQLGERLLLKDPNHVTPVERRQLKEFQAALAGRLSIMDLSRALALIAAKSSTPSPAASAGPADELIKVELPETWREDYGTENREVALLLARFLKDKSDTLLNHKLLSRAVQLDPDCGFAWFHYAYVRGTMGDIERSLESYRRSVKLSENTSVAATARNNIGITYGRLSQYALSSAAFREGMLATPNNSYGELPKSYRNHGVNLAEQGRTYDASFAAWCAYMIKPTEQCFQMYAKLNNESGPMVAARLFDPEAPHQQLVRTVGSDLHAIAVPQDGRYAEMKACRWYAVSAPDRFVGFHGKNIHTIDPQSPGVVQTTTWSSMVKRQCVVDGVLYIISDQPRQLCRLRWHQSQWVIDRHWALGDVSVPTSMAVSHQAGIALVVDKRSDHQPGRIMHVDLASGTVRATPWQANVVRMTADGSKAFGLFVRGHSKEEVQALKAYQVAMDKWHASSPMQNPGAFSHNPIGGFNPYNPTVPRTHGLHGMGGVQNDFFQRQNQHMMSVPSSPRIIRPRVLVQYRVLPNGLAAEQHRTRFGNGDCPLILDPDDRYITYTGYGKYLPNVAGRPSYLGPMTFDTNDLAVDGHVIDDRAADVSGRVEQLAINPVTGQVALSYDKEVVVRDLPCNEVKHTLAYDHVYAMCWSQDGRYLLIQHNQVGDKPHISLHEERGLTAPERAKATQRRQAQLAMRRRPTQAHASTTPAMTAMRRAETPVQLVKHHARAALKNFTPATGVSDLTAIKQQLDRPPHVAAGAWGTLVDHADHPAAETFTAAAKQADGTLEENGVAIFNLRNLLKDHPDYAPALWVLGRLYAGQRRWKEARDLLIKAIRLDSGRTQVTTNALNILSQNEVDKAARLSCQIWHVWLSPQNGQLRQQVTDELKTMHFTDLAEHLLNWNRNQ